MSKNLKNSDFLEKIDDYEMVLPICERCKTVIETFISEQWWVKMNEMRDMALELKRETIFRVLPQNPSKKSLYDLARKSEGLDDIAPTLVGTSDSGVV